MATLSLHISVPASAKDKTTGKATSSELFRKELSKMFDADTKAAEYIADPEQRAQRKLAIQASADALEPYVETIAGVLAGRAANVSLSMQSDVDSTVKERLSLAVDFV